MNKNYRTHISAAEQIKTNSEKCIFKKNNWTVSTKLIFGLLFNQPEKLSKKSSSLEIKHKKDVKNHILSTHYMYKLGFKCSFCEKYFASRPKLSGHILNSEDDAPPDGRKKRIQATLFWW